MNQRNLPALALFVGVLALPTFAVAAHVPLSEQALAARAEAATALFAATATPQPKVAGTATRPGSLQANPLRAYPPSCAAAPLPNKPSGPTWSKLVPVFATNQSHNGFIEEIRVTVWRLACSSSGSPTEYNPTGAANAMTLVRFDRSADHEGNSFVWPTFPYIQVEQGDIDVLDPKSLVRLAPEPNTFVAEAVYNTPIVNSATYVLENYASEDAGYFRFNDAFTLSINPILNGVAAVKIEVPAYAPTGTDYPDTLQPRELDGYSAAQWTNSELGEGLLLQVTEQPQSNGTTVRQVVFDLLLEDNNGDPLWLVGNAPFPVGTKSLDINLSYLGNGLAQIPWGSATIEVADCNHLEVTYHGQPQTDIVIPVFEGLTTYDRLFAPNGMVCE